MNIANKLLSAAVLVLLMTGLAPSGVAQSASISAQAAWDAVEAGQLLLVDIRQPEEWAQTGMARHAIGISMVHAEGQQGFLRDLVTAANGRLDAPIALICRTGNRTSQVRQALESMGFTNIRHVPEGMVGSTYGPGWIATGLPLEPCHSC
ncbi:MAG: rhodanese-like domain-containing protein [Wenzhouxiangella sp.]|nr:MAG: rhodanese-like domain-containing protein [Wenzhouxiangella sp.]